MIEENVMIPQTLSQFILPPQSNKQEIEGGEFSLVVRKLWEFLETDQNPDARLEDLRAISQLPGYLDELTLNALAEKCLLDTDYHIRGEMCYLLGMAARTLFIPNLRWLSQEDPNPWVQEQAINAISMLEQADEADYSLTQKPIQIRNDNVDVDKDIWQFLAGNALHHANPLFRIEACHLILKWSNLHKHRAARFGPELRHISQYDENAQVREQAATAAQELAIIKDNSIDITLFAIADPQRKEQVLQQISQEAETFDLATRQALIDYALHDPEAAIRKQACQLLTQWAATDAWRWRRFEPQVYWMAFHDPDLWVCKQAVQAARKLYWPALIQRWAFFVLLYLVFSGIILGIILLRGSEFRLPGAIPVGAMYYLVCENQYAAIVADAAGTHRSERAIGPPDSLYASIGLEANSYLILDLGEGNAFITRPGVDFYFYERPYDPGIRLDAIQVSVAQDTGSGVPEPSAFGVVFVWGDNDPSNNGSIPPEYFSGNIETPDQPIEAGHLYNNTGIGIDIGGDDNVAYRFVRFQTFPPDAPAPDPDLMAEVDAVEKLCPPPTSTPSPTETASATETPEPTDTPSFTPAPTETPTFTETPLPSDTSTATLTPAPSETSTPTPTHTSTETLPPSYTPTPSETSTASPTTTLTPTETPIPTETPTLTLTPTASEVSTSTPTKTPIPSETTTLTITPTASEISTSTPTNTLTPTKTSFHPSGTPTLTPTATSLETSTPSLTNTLTPAFTSSPTLPPSKTPTRTSSPAFTLSPTTTARNTPTRTLSPTKTATSVIPTPTSTRTASYTPSPTATRRPTSTKTLKPTSISSPSLTPSFTLTPGATSTGIPSPSRTNTHYPQPTKTQTPKPVKTLTLTPSRTASPWTTTTPIYLPTPSLTQTIPQILTPIASASSTFTLPPTLATTLSGPINTLTPTQIPKTTNIAPPPLSSTPTKTSQDEEISEESKLPYFIAVLGSELLVLYIIGLIQVNKAVQLNRQDKKVSKILQSKSPPLSSDKPQPKKDVLLSSSKANPPAKTRGAKHP